MGFKTMKRNQDKLKSILVDTGDSIITKIACKILIPYNYLNYKLVSIGEKITVLAVAAVVMGEEYGVINGCCGLTIAPSTTKQVMIDGQEYLEFGFLAGDVVVSETTIVKDSDLLYEMNKYFYSNGRIPPFLNYFDVGNLFTHHKEYGGLNIAPNNTPFEIVASMICRDPDNKYTYYRHTEMKKLPVVIPFNSVLFNTTNTTAKLLGADLEDGFTSALVNPSEQTESIENLLRL